jgi:hypothetical protein
MQVIIATKYFNLDNLYQRYSVIYKYIIFFIANSQLIVFGITWLLREGN